MGLRPGIQLTKNGEVGVSTLVPSPKEPPVADRRGATPIGVCVADLAAKEQPAPVYRRRDAEASK